MLIWIVGQLQKSLRRRRWLFAANPIRRLQLPSDIPVNDFWSAILYSNQTRSMIQTDQVVPSVSSQTKGLLVNADGSVDVYFGPKAPPGKEINWVQTIPGNGWNTIL